MNFNHVQSDHFGCGEIQEKGADPHYIYSIYTYIYIIIDPLYIYICITHTHYTHNNNGTHYIWL